MPVKDFPGSVVVENKANQIAMAKSFVVANLMEQMGVFCTVNQITNFSPGLEIKKEELEVGTKITVLLRCKYDDRKTKVLDAVSNKK